MRSYSSPEQWDLSLLRTESKLYATYEVFYVTLRQIILKHVQYTTSLNMFIDLMNKSYNTFSQGKR